MFTNVLTVEVMAVTEKAEAAGTCPDCSHVVPGIPPEYACLHALFKYVAYMLHAADATWVQHGDETSKKVAPSMRGVASTLRRRAGWSTDWRPLSNESPRSESSLQLFPPLIIAAFHRTVLLAGVQDVLHFALRQL